MRVFPQADDPVFMVCNLWGVWIQLVLGLWLWICTFIFRLWRLFLILKMKYPSRKIILYASFFIFWGPSLIYGSVSSIFNVNGPSEYQEGVFICRFRDAPSYAAFGLALIYILCAGVSLFFFLLFHYLLIKTTN